MRGRQFESYTQSIFPPRGLMPQGASPIDFPSVPTYQGLRQQRKLIVSLN